LEVLREKAPAKYLALETKHMGRISSTEGIRQIAARQMSNQPAVEFFNDVMNFKQQETLNAWQDRWSPRELLEDNAFHYLADATVTRINGVQFEADSGLIGFQRANGTEGCIREERLAVYIAQLRFDVETQLSRMGSVHWGTASDVARLSEALDLGFLILPDHKTGLPRDLRGWMYGIATTRGDFSHWMLLYCNQQVHFQLAALHTQQQRYQIIFSTEELPALLRYHYDLNNANAPVGSERTVGVV